ncbi:MAG: calcium-binding protein [Nitratireductor sp.]
MTVASAALSGFAVLLATSLKSAANGSGENDESFQSAKLDTDDVGSHARFNPDPGASIDSLMGSVHQTNGQAVAEDAKIRLASMFGQPVTDAYLGGQDHAGGLDLTNGGIAQSLGVSDPAQGIRGIVVNHDREALPASNTVVVSGGSSTSDMTIEEHNSYETTNVFYTTNVTEVTEVTEITNITNITNVTNNYYDGTDNPDGPQNPGGDNNDGDEPTDVTDQVIYGTALADDLKGAGGADLIYGLDGNDILTGFSGQDELYGGKGDDILKGGHGADIIDGGDGNDTADYSASDEGVEIDLELGDAIGGDAENDRLISIENLIGSIHDDFLYGDDFDNVISGGAGNDDLYGGYGKDFLTGGAGADWIDGGMGTEDVAEYVTSSEGVTVSLIDGSGHGGDAEGDTLLGIEYLHGSLFDDFLEGDDGINRLMGRTGDDWLVGNGGDDTLIGGYGADHMDGGAGIDTVEYASSDHGVTVNLATGYSFGGEATGDEFVSIENIAGTEFDDILTGNALDNRLTGRDGDDILDGGAGNDVLVGGEGADTLIGGAGSRDVADYSAAGSGVGVDLKSTGFEGEATGDSYSGIEFVYGSNQADIIHGNDEINRLVGNGGDDYLAGRGGDDYFVGGLGNDTLNGGSGADVFIFGGTFGNDTIEDFSAGLGRTDRIWINDNTVSGWEVLQSLLTDTSDGAMMQLNGGTVLIENVHVADLVADDFIFA